jgi:hypothetical protein
MKAKRLALTCAVAAMTFAAGATANEIYKWTDAEGNVHYEDRPTGAPTEQRIDIQYRRTDDGAVGQRIQARLDRQAERAEAKSTAAAREQEAAEQAAAAEERAKACEGARARLESYLQSRRLYRTDASGERVYLDDAQRQEARQKAEEQVTEFCS